MKTSVISSNLDWVTNPVFCQLMICECAQHWVTGRVWYTAIYAVSEYHSEQICGLRVTALLIYTPIRIWLYQVK